MEAESVDAAKPEGHPVADRFALQVLVRLPSSKALGWVLTAQVELSLHLEGLRHPACAKGCQMFGSENAGLAVLWITGKAK